METKVTAAGLAGAVSQIAIWLIESNSNVDVPTAVATAIVIVATFALGWAVPNGRLAASTIAKANQPSN